jgi:hypothetical protein
VIGCLELAAYAGANGAAANNPIAITDAVNTCFMALSPFADGH